MKTLSRRQPGFALVGFVLLSLSAGAVGGIATAGSIGGWYQTIAKPDWNPPGWVFGPVWTTLYLMMGVAAWIVWRQAGPGTKAWPLALFAVQLALNALWSFVFFAWHQIGWALVEILALWVAITATIASFLRVSKVAAVLLVPYLAWVSFASFLTYTIWTLNR